MKIYSWNVNGIRAIVKKGFLDWFNKLDADFVCLQEPKAFINQVPRELKSPRDFNLYFHNGTVPGYSGTVIYSKQKALSVGYGFDNMPSVFVNDGRVIELEFDSFFLLNIYFPNGGPKANGTDMLPFKLDFYKSFLEHIEKLRLTKKSIIMCGDFNIVHQAIDIARPKENENSIGFTLPERKWISRIIEKDYIDVWRAQNPDAKDTYSWWSYRTRARERNIGWRIDYFFLTKNLMNKVNKTDYLPLVMGSDHCPLYLDINL